MKVGAAYWTLLAGIFLYCALAEPSLAASPTTTILESFPNPSAGGTSATFSATVAGYGGGAPIGTVTFSEEGSSLGTTSLSAVGVGRTISSAGPHTCAVTAAGGVVCWGFNGYGQFGDGTDVDSNAPIAATGLGSEVVAVAAGFEHSCALTGAGAVYCWGRNEFGNLGDGTITDRNTPVIVATLASGVIAIAAGRHHSCAVMANGTVKCWGSNAQGQVGDGSLDDRAGPVEVSGLTGVKAIDAGDSHTCAVTADGSVYCWGSNLHGQLGDGTTDDQTTPVLVSGLFATAVSAGHSHSCAITTSGGAKCWGKNELGGIGDGTTDDRHTPVDVVGLSSGVGAIAAGDSYTNFTCALTTTGAIRCWGTGNTVDSATPVDQPGLADPASAIALGYFYDCAVTQAGGVRCWGPPDVVTEEIAPDVSGVSALVYARATYATSTLAPGEHEIIASYPGNATHLPSVSMPLTHTVSISGTATSMVGSTHTSVFGEAVTFTATVTAPGQTPSGQVVFKRGSNTIGSASLIAGMARLSTNSLSVGISPIVAVYAGGGSFTGSTSTGWALTVTKAATTTTLTASPNPSTFGESVTLTALVALVSPSERRPTGSVTFKKGSEVLGSATLSLIAVSDLTARAVFSTDTLAGGTHTITATYSGNAGFVGSSSSAVAHSVRFTITLSTEPSVAGTTSGAGTFAAGATRTVVAQPAAGAWNFYRWTENGVTVSHSASYTFPLNKNRNLVANYPSVSLALSALPTQGGSVTGGGIFPPGSGRVVSAIPAANYNFYKWTDTGMFGLVSMRPVEFITLYGNRALTAHFNGPEFRVNEATIRSQRAPAIATLANGKTVVVHQSSAHIPSFNTPQWGVFRQMFTATGGRHGFEHAVNTSWTSAQYEPAVAALGGDDYIVTWTRTRYPDTDVFGRRYDGLLPVGNEFRINTSTAGNQHQSSVAGLKDGGFVVVWMSPDGSGNGIYGQRFRADGQKAGSEFRVNHNTRSEQQSPVVAVLKDGSFVVAWDDDSFGGGARLISLKGFDATGQPLCNCSWVAFDPGGAVVQFEPAVAATGDGAFVVAWTDDAIPNVWPDAEYNVFARRFTIGRFPLGPPFRVNTAVAGHQRHPSVTGFPQGGFAVAWTSLAAGQDGSGYGVYAQRYAAAGFPVGSEFRVNVHTRGHQHEPAVAGLPGGHALAAWTSNFQDGNLEGVYGVRIRPL